MCRTLNADLRTIIATNQYWRGPQGMPRQQTSAAKAPGQVLSNNYSVENARYAVLLASARRRARTAAASFSSSAALSSQPMQASVILWP